MNHGETDLLRDCEIDPGMWLRMVTAARECGVGVERLQRMTTVEFKRLMRKRMADIDAQLKRGQA